MSRINQKWKGSSVDEFIDEQLADPEIRIAFSEAKARRIKRALADIIRRTREKSDITQSELARKAKTTQAVISRMENPDVKYIPSVEVLSRVALALDTHLELAFVPENRPAT